MGFSSVFRSLQEVFPQVDIRVLKAVAIEHPKDADAAVECVLSEVLPHLVNQSESHCTQNDSRNVDHSTVGEEPRQGVVEGVIADSHLNSVFDASELANDSINTTAALYGDAKCVNEQSVGSSVFNLHGGNGDELQMSTCGLGNTSLDQPSAHLFFSTETEELISLEKSQNVSVADGSDQVSLVGPGPLIQEDCFTDCFNDASSFTIKDLNELVIRDSWPPSGDTHQDQTCIDADSLKVENLPASVQLIPSSRESQVEISDSAHYGSLSANIGATIGNFEKPDSRSSSDNVSTEEVFDAEVGDVENGSSSIAIVSHSSQICSIDLLEESVGEARNNKRTLFLAMESVINKMKELEFQEEAAEQAKRNVAVSGLDIFAKVEDLREMLQHAKEANDMHAGEVYGEKAILSTELRELQSRILNLSDEREKSLAILDEMSQTLEIRLAVAKEERKIAEQEKLENEKSARMVLAEQELAMERVVEESKRLQQQAEENSKLRDFLMDRGRVVDILQGEIAVICQDVKLLKEKFDECVPISKSLSSSQTSCILASSSSSMKSLAPDRVSDKAEASEALALEKTSPAPLFVGEVQRSSFEEKTVAGDNKIPLDDGWEFFDDEV